MVLHKLYNRLRLAPVKEFIQTGGDVNAYNKSGWTLLHRAAYHGHVEVARELIGANADVHLKVRESARPMLCSTTSYIYQVWLRFVYFLMKLTILDANTAFNEPVGMRADSDMYWKVKESGRTALHVAACYGHHGLVTLFLDTDIGINEQDDGGMTALMLAVVSGHNAVVAELVKAGADINLEAKNGMTAVLLAKSYDMVCQLVKDVDCQSRGDRSRILWHACDVGDLSMARSGIEAGCDVDHIHQGQTPVMMAALRGHDSIVKELILANCNVKFKSDIFSGSSITPNFGSLNRASYWMAVAVCVLMPWMKFQMDVVATPWNNPVWSSLMLLAVSVLAVVVLLLIPELWDVMLLVVYWMVGTTVIIVLNAAMVAGPVAWTASVLVFLVILLVIRGPKATTADLTREVVEVVVFVTFIVCIALVMESAVPVVLVWSPQGGVIAISDQAAGILMIVAVSLITISLFLKRMELILQSLVVGVLEGVILKVELFVIASSCIKIGRKAIILHESQAVQRMVEVWVTLTLFIWFLLMALRTRSTKITLCRAAVVIFVFEATKLLRIENTMMSLNKLCVVIVVLVLTRIFAGVAIVSKKTVYLWGLLYLVVAVAEAHLAVFLSNEREDLGIQRGSVKDFMNITMALVVVLSIRAANVTALHYAAGQNCINCGVLLVEAGADVRASDKYFHDPLDVGFTPFVEELQKALSFTTKRVVAVIGATECGKSTLVAALEHTSNILWKKVINRFKKVHDIRQRTAGIEAVQLSNQKYGEALVYDFAGQSQYHGPHQSFLEAMLCRPEVTVTLLVLVKATEEEEVITQQLFCWLQPLALVCAPSTQVIIIGSFLDQAKTRKAASEKLLRCTQSVRKELPLTFDLQGPCLLDCRQPESRGINEICTILQQTLPADPDSLSYNLHWVLVQLRKAFSTPAIPLHVFQKWLHDQAGHLPKKLPQPEEVCQDLSAAGHTLFLVNKQDPLQSWLILNLESILHNVYGTLFSGSQCKVNKFGLLHCSQLAELFPKLDLEVICEVLSSLEFCLQIDPTILDEELSQLTMDMTGEGWLYFPALVSAQPREVFPEYPDPEQCQWMCWQLRTAKKRFISAHLLQTIIIRLAANHVFTHELSPSVKKHCCTVWVNGLSWRSTRGVDVAVQIYHCTMVQVIGRSQAGSERLHKYTSTIVRDIIKTIVQLSPQLEATAYIIQPYTLNLLEHPNALEPDQLYPTSSIIRCISNDDDYVLSLPNEESNYPQQMSLLKLFGGWSPSLSVVQDLDFRESSRGSAGE